MCSGKVKQADLSHLGSHHHQGGARFLLIWTKLLRGILQVLAAIIGGVHLFLLIIVLLSLFSQVAIMQVEQASQDSVVPSAVFSMSTSWSAVLLPPVRLRVPPRLGARRKAGQDRETETWPRSCPLCVRTLPAPSPHICVF